jgi:hypothetical protein
MSLPYHLYLLKRAAAAPPEPYAPDTILRYPWKGNAPADLNELADRREALAAKIGIGASLGAGAGLLARKLIPKTVSDPSLRVLARYAHAVAPLVSASFGSIAGVGAHAVTSTLDKVHKHQAAVDNYYAHGGKPLPFLVRHPYAAAMAAPFIAGPAGMAVGAAAATALGRHPVAGLGLGAAIGSTLAEPLINKMRRDQLADAFPHLKLRANELEDSDSIYTA